MAISDAVLAHRADYWTWVEAHSTEPQRGTLLALRDHWRTVNAEHFGKLMAEPYITLSEPSTPSLLGQCYAVSSWGSRLEIRIRPSLLLGTHPRIAGGDRYREGRLRFVADVVTHEMVHQWHMEHSGISEDAYHGHGPSFTECANGIGRSWGLPPVVAKRRNGSEEPRAAQWPHNVRPADYYAGAYLPTVPTTRDTVPCSHCAGTGRTPKENQP